METSNLTTLTLTPEECKSFLKWREYQDKFEVLLENGVFNIRNGSALINFDSIGNLTQIDINVLMYKKGFPQVVTIVKL